MKFRYEEFVSQPGHASLQGDGYVHPQFKRLGVGTALLRALEQRARLEIPRAAPDLRVFLRNFMTIGNESGRALHAAEGFRAVRYNWAMQIELAAPPPAPQFPAGVEIRPFDEAQHLFPLYQAVEEAFADHWGHIRVDFDSWKKRNLAPERYRPDLWLVPGPVTKLPGPRFAVIAAGWAGWESYASAAPGANKAWAWPCCGAPSTNFTGADNFPSACM
ncbi:MAG: hypothetical protein Fur0035_03400 [Anaerolineales bacterium]